MKKVGEWTQFAAGLALFMSFVVLGGCASLNESLAKKRTTLASKLGLVIKCPCIHEDKHCHKLKTCNYCPPGYEVDQH